MVRSRGQPSVLDRCADCVTLGWLLACRMDAWLVGMRAVDKHKGNRLILANIYSVNLDE